MATVSSISNRDMVRRSMLIVPANVSRFVDKAASRGADAVMLDLEDSIPPSQKVAARAGLDKALTRVVQGHTDVLVRINNSPGHLGEDISAAAQPGVAAIFVPKVQSADIIKQVDDLISAREAISGLPHGSIGLSASIESAAGMLHDSAIAHASPRLQTLTSAIEDLAADLDLVLSSDASELYWVKQRVIIVAREAELLPMGVVGRIGNYRDLDGFRAAATRARGMGYLGAGCIHPDQVRILNEVFTPDTAQMERASKVVAGAEKAGKLGRGAFAVGGDMADAATLLWAQRVLRRAQLIEARQSQLTARDQ